jgi:hypothetical protein
MATIVTDRPGVVAEPSRQRRAAQRRGSEHASHEGQSSEPEADASASRNPPSVPHGVCIAGNPDDDAERLDAELLRSLGCFQPLHIARRKRVCIARALLICQRKAYQVVITHDQDEETVALSLQLLAAAALCEQDQATLDKVQARVPVIRIDPSAEEREIRVQGWSRCADKESPRAALMFLVKYIGHVLTDDRLQGLVAKA